VDLSAAAMGWTDDAEAAFRHAEDAALRAIALDEFDPAAHALLGRTYARTGQYDRAVETLRHAVRRNPSEPEGYAALGDALLWTGDLGGAAEALETALAMDPRRSAEDLFSLGAAYLLAGRSADAIRILERATQRNEGNPYIYAVLAAAYAASGRAAEARSAAAEARRRDPFLDLDSFGSLFRKPEHRERFARALKSAGL
jgi:tetratricopeptide (TPR) repeat protein